jgi:hypothetical protein
VILLRTIVTSEGAELRGLSTTSEGTEVGRVDVEKVDPDVIVLLGDSESSSMVLLVLGGPVELSIETKEQLASGDVGRIEVPWEIVVLTELALDLLRSSALRLTLSFSSCVIYIFGGLDSSLETPRPTDV